MKFNERVHAYIAASYYKAVFELFPENAEDIFRFAVYQYGEQRGRRMAQKALRDKKPLTHYTFQEYNELIATSGDGVVPADGELAGLSPDYELHITNCPWHDEFRETDNLQAGALYCSLIDEAVMTGFNPKVRFISGSSLNTASYCQHIVKDVYYTEYPDPPQRKDLAHDFEYHCADLFYAMKEAIESIDGEAGRKAADIVLEKTVERYGKGAEELLKYASVDFKNS